MPVALFQPHCRPKEKRAVILTVATPKEAAMTPRALLAVMLISLIGGTGTANGKQDSAQHRAAPLPG